MKKYLWMLQMYEGLGTILYSSILDNPQWDKWILPLVFFFYTMCWVGKSWTEYFWWILMSQLVSARPVCLSLLTQVLVFIFCSLLLQLNLWYLLIHNKLFWALARSLLFLQTECQWFDLFPKKMGRLTLSVLAITGVSVILEGSRVCLSHDTNLLQTWINLYCTGKFLQSELAEEL